MPAPLNGPGLGLFLPQYFYPTEFDNAPYDYSTNRQALAPGQQIPVPAGTWYINLGLYLRAAVSRSSDGHLDVRLKCLVWARDSLR